MWALHRLGLYQIVLVVEKLAPEIEHLCVEGAHKDLERFVIHRRRLGGINPIALVFEQGATAAHPQHQPAAAQMVEHADFLVEPERMVEREHVNQWPQPDSVRALECGREKYARARCPAERRRMMLGQMIAVKPCPLE
jgi:hypothetical protein